MSTQPDLHRAERVAMQLVVPYDLAQFVLALITHREGHVAVMERQHRRGQYKLSVNVPTKHRKEFEKYEIKS